MMTKRLSVMVAAVPLFLVAPCGAFSGLANAEVPSTPMAVTAELQPQGAGKKRLPPRPPKLDMTLLQAFFGSEPAAPKSDNTVTDDKVALGKLLYHEKALSKNGNISCASCHDLANWGQDGKPVSPGSDGKNGVRNSPTTLNAFRQFAQFWDGRAATIEDQAIAPVLNPIEHGLADEAELIAKIKGKPELVVAFGKAFPGDDAITAANFQSAVGAFQRKLVTRSPFDEFLDGKNSALTTDQKIGLKLFIDVGCTACHTTRLVGGQMYQKLGLMRPYPSKDEGRFEVTKNEADKSMFKVTSLLNVAKTAPYMHDGALTSLPEVVKLMAQIQLNRELTDEEVASIVAFLESLTGKLPDGIAIK